LTDLHVSEYFETATLSTTRGHNHKLFKNVVQLQLMYDRSFSVNGWLTAGMIDLPVTVDFSFLASFIRNVFISLIV